MDGPRKDSETPCVSVKVCEKQPVVGVCPAAPCWHILPNPSAQGELPLSSGLQA